MSQNQSFRSKTQARRDRNAQRRIRRKMARNSPLLKLKNNEQAPALAAKAPVKRPQKSDRVRVLRGCPQRYLNRPATVLEIVDGECLLEVTGRKTPLKVSLADIEQA